MSELELKLNTAPYTKLCHTQSNDFKQTKKKISVNDSHYISIITF